MRLVYVLQHCEGEFLGLIEDHFEGRGIRFTYIRPFADGVRVPGTAAQADGLVLMGGGAWGTAGSRPLPMIETEARLTRDFLRRGRPVIAWGVGAQILCLAAGGSAVQHGFTTAVDLASRSEEMALGGYLPETFPLVTIMRDVPIPPAEARVLARDSMARPAVFQIGTNAIGFTGHPGMKPGMAEDLMMEFDEPAVGLDGEPADPVAFLAAVRNVQHAVADALVSIMAGLVQATGLMEPYSEAEYKRRTIIPMGG